MPLSKKHKDCCCRREAHKLQLLLLILMMSMSMIMMMSTMTSCLVISHPTLTTKKNRIFVPFAITL